MLPSVAQPLTRCLSSGGVVIGSRGKACLLRKIGDDAREGVESLSVDFNQECMVLIPPMEDCATVHLMVGHAALVPCLTSGHGRNLQESPSPAYGEARCVGQARLAVRDLKIGDAREGWVQLEDPAEVAGDLVIDLVEARNLASNGREGIAIGRMTLRWHESRYVSQQLDGMGRAMSPLMSETGSFNKFSRTSSGHGDNTDGFFSRASSAASQSKERQQAFEGEDDYSENEGTRRTGKEKRKSKVGHQAAGSPSRGKRGSTFGADSSRFLTRANETAPTVKGKTTPALKGHRSNEQDEKPLDRLEWREEYWVSLVSRAC